MKKIVRFLAAVLFMAIAHILSAQDTITLKTGEEINVKVLEVGTIDIKYKKTDNLNGPSYTISKNDVLMIRYQNGSKDVFSVTNPAPKAPAPSQAAPSNNVDTHKEVDEGARNYEAQQEYDKNMRLYRTKLGSGIACTAIGVPFLISGSALVGVGVNYLQNSRIYSYGSFSTVDDRLATKGRAMIASGAILLATSIPLTIVGPIKISRSLKYKKRAQDAKAALSFVPSVIPANGIVATQTGMAMRLTF